MRGCPVGAARGPTGRRPGSSADLAGAARSRPAARVHPFTYEPPYFPGYRDIWDNIVVARTAALPWNAQRFVAYLILGGILDRWPNLRVAFMETSAGWLHWWLKRLDMNMHYLSHAVDLPAKSLLEYVRDGRVSCAIELYEGADTAKALIDLCGERVPHVLVGLPALRMPVARLAQRGERLVGR